MSIGALNYFSCSYGLTVFVQGRLSELEKQVSELKVVREGLLCELAICALCPWLLFMVIILLFACCLCLFQRKCFSLFCILFS